MLLAVQKRIPMHAITEYFIPGKGVSLGGKYPKLGNNFEGSAIHQRLLEAYRKVRG